MPDWAPIRAALHSAGIDVEGAEPRPVVGGDISAAWRLDSAAGSVFLKTGPASSYEMFAAEAEGLSELAQANAVRVPAVIALGEHRDSAFVALEWLRFESIGRASERRLGEQLEGTGRPESIRANRRPVDKPLSDAKPVRSTLSL